MYKVLSQCLKLRAFHLLSGATLHPWVGILSCWTSLPGKERERKSLSFVNGGRPGCGRPALNFIERFWLGLVHSASQVDLKVYSNELWNGLHNYAQVYRNLLPCTPNSSSTLALCQSCLLIPVYLRVLFKKSRRISLVLVACPVSDTLNVYYGRRRATLWKCCCVCCYYILLWLSLSK